MYVKQKNNSNRLVFSAVLGDNKKVWEITVVNRNLAYCCQRMEKNPCYFVAFLSNVVVLSYQWKEDR